MTHATMDAIGPVSDETKYLAVLKAIAEHWDKLKVRSGFSDQRQQNGYYQLSDFQKAIKEQHRPTSVGDHETAKWHFILEGEDEFLVWFKLTYL